MAGSVIYHRLDGAVSSVVPDAADPQLFRDLLLVRRLEDVSGHVAADEDGLISVGGEVFYSSNSLESPDGVYDQAIGSGDGVNACWSPDPAGAVPEYVGVRFTTPVRVTGFRFACCVSNRGDCPGGVGPCAYPTDFVLQGSNDEVTWTTLLGLSDFTGVAVVDETPFGGEVTTWWDGSIFLSDRLDVENDQFYLAYRLVVSDFCPDLSGGYILSELIFYGAA